jgi:hypothetical protein
MNAKSPFLRTGAIVPAFFLTCSLIAAVDQQQTLTDVFIGVSPISGPGLHWQQGVTAGVTGQLTGIELFLDGPNLGAVNFGINLGAPWQTDADLIVVTTPVNSLGWNFYDLSTANINLSAGQQFTINIREGGWGMAPQATTISAYSGGALYYFNELSPGNPPVPEAFDVMDLAFRTHMGPTTGTIPDSGTTATMLGLSLAGLIGLRRLLA